MIWIRRQAAIAQIKLRHCIKNVEVEDLLVIYEGKEFYRESQEKQK